MASEYGGSESAARIGRPPKGAAKFTLHEWLQTSRPNAYSGDLPNERPNVYMCRICNSTVIAHKHTAYYFKRHEESKSHLKAVKKQQAHNGRVGGCCIMWGCWWSMIARVLCVVVYDGSGSCG